VNLRVAENFSLTTGYFDGGGDAVPVAGTGGPNASLIVPLSTQRSSLTTVETNYHFALNDLIGASGSFYDLHFTNLLRRLGWNPVDDFADRFGNRVRVCLLATPDLWRRLGGHKLPFCADQL